MRVGALFAGYGGLERGLAQVLPTELAWVSEIDPGACKILAHHWPDVPNHGDITKVDWTQVEPVDVLTGGFPCTDVSHAGKRAGLGPGTRSGLWSEMARAIAALHPSLVVIENVRGLLSAKADRSPDAVDLPDDWTEYVDAAPISADDTEADTDRDLGPDDGDLGDDDPGPVLLRAMGAVLGDLAELGFDAEWRGVRAADVGAPHGRFRAFIVAWPAADVRHDAGSARSSGPAVTGGASAWEPSDEPGRPTRTAQDADGSARGQRRQSAPGQAQGGWAWADAGGRGGAPAPDAGPADRGGSSADATGDGRHEGRSEPAGIVRGPDAAERGHAVTDTDVARLERRSDAGGRDATDDRARGRRHVGPLLDRHVDWGVYEPAIRRWEHLTRPAPAPTEPGPKGGQRLSPRFVEWLMGLPDGHVTDPAIWHGMTPGAARNAQLKALGNGVVPAQAARALRLLLGLPTPDVSTLLPTPDVSSGLRSADAHARRDRQVSLQDLPHLLPTPAVNDMGAGTPGDWDEWTDAVKARQGNGNGNGHGKSLEIEALRLIPDGAA